MGTGANILHDSLMHMSMYFSLLRCFLIKQSEHAQLKVAGVTLTSYTRLLQIKGVVMGTKMPK